MSTTAPFRPAIGSEPIPGYRLEAFLGKGGFGEVWRATAPGGFQVAIKFLAADAPGAARELRSLEMLARIRDGHLLSVFSVNQFGGWYVLAMELADGTLLDILHACQKAGQPGIPRDELLRYFSQAAGALDFLNEPRHVLVEGGAPTRVQHGDVKPQNLLLVGRVCKVGDFGLLRRLSTSVGQQTSSMTPAYAAPEIFEGSPAVASDQYALAVTWCQLRGGRLPFEGGPVQLMNAHLRKQPDLSMLPQAERPAVARALAKSAEQRWPSCQALVDALGAAGPGPLPSPAVVVPTTPSTSALSVPPLPSSTRPAPPLRRRTPATLRGGGWGLALVGMALLSAAVVLGSLWWLGSRAGQGHNQQASDGSPRDRKDKPEGKPDKDARDKTEKDAALKDKDARDKDRKEPGPKDQREGTNSLRMTLVRIEPGTFWMGSPFGEQGRCDDEGPQHEVEITQAFYLAAHPVTVGQFRQFVQDKQAHGGQEFQTEAEREGKTSTWRSPGITQTAEHPVVYVSWNDADAFCKWLSKKEGKTYELPTEAEWEYACRAGPPTRETKRFFFGDDEAKLRDYAWYFKNSGGSTHPVGTKNPNPWGLYDMHGNVWQWCADGKREYRSHNEKDPVGGNSTRVVRGGSWNNGAWNCRAAYRDVGDPGRRYFVGFRVVLRPS
jgi:formylglycine-generating enzyme required for sulfatase activity/serine/threonine protein kinase